MRRLRFGDGGIKSATFQTMKLPSFNVSCCAAFCSCGRGPGLLDVSTLAKADGTLQTAIAFGSSTNVCLFKANEEARTVPVSCSTYSAHAKDVTAVRWVTGSFPSDPRAHLLSCSSDGVVVLWRVVLGELVASKSWRRHRSSATLAAGIHLPSGRLLLCSASADSQLSLFLFRPQGEGDEAETRLRFGRGFVLSADFLIAPDQFVFLATGHDDNKIRLHASQLGGNESCMVCVCELSGHSDWVRSLRFRPPVDDAPEILLASAGQEGIVRVWKIAKKEMEAGEKEWKLKAQTFRLPNQNDEGPEYEARLETVLMAHEDWICSVCWQPGEQLQLLSASMDKCIISWAPDPHTGIWLETTRVGEVGGQSGGYLGAAYLWNGTAILGHTYSGGFHLWRRNAMSGRWELGTAPSGHFQSVEDVCWSPSGGYLLSCSLDQTTRIWAQNFDGSFQEFSRAQIHGYDMQCLTTVSETCFVSAGEEKILRAFRAPKTFLSIFARHSKTLVPFSADKDAAVCASLPPLGLSNKAVTGDFEDDEIQPSDELPTENELMGSTLWPEECKLYGHGSEVFCVSCNHSGSLVASSCKASGAEQAVILLWDTRDWQLRGRLASHALTVTDMSFSPSDALLLSVSRDRSWTLFAPSSAPEDASLFCWEVRARPTSKADSHSRIIWRCAWSHDSRFFLTVSRDKTVLVLEVGKEGTVEPACAHLQLGEAVTAGDFAPRHLFQNRYLLAFGLDNGTILMHSWNKQSGFQLLHSLNQSDGHTLSVKRLRFRPLLDEDGVFYLASGSSDHSLKIFSIKAVHYDDI